MALPLHRADCALSLLLRALLAGCVCVPLLGGIYAVHVARQVGSVGFSDDCIADACVWISDGDWSLTFPPTQPCWRLSWRPC